MPHHRSVFFTARWFTKRTFRRHFISSMILVCAAAYFLLKA